MARALPLPSFRYHPDPLETASIVLSRATCSACGEARGFAYTGPVYGEDVVDDVCPWCVADGSAAEKFDAEFTDVGAGVPDGIDAAVLDELATRTPGFTGWQQEHWLYHCNDAMAFLGRADKSPHDDEAPSVYVFRCLHCNAEDSYTDEP
jgi:uncharacterized protein CbrC (UPF0167 family)